MDIETAESLIREHQQTSSQGVIVEPFQRACFRRPPEGFLEGLRKSTRAYGIPLIFDEVVTGFRFGLRRRAALLRRGRPDLCTLGKVIGGGGFPSRRSREGRIS